MASGVWRGRRLFTSGSGASVRPPRLRHGYQRPLHQLQEGRRGSRAVRTPQPRESAAPSKRLQPWVCRGRPGQAGALASAPDPPKAPPSQATEGPRQLPQRGYAGAGPRGGAGEDRHGRPGGEVGGEEVHPPSAGGRPGTPDVFPLMPLDLALGTCRDQNRPPVTGDSEIHKCS